MALVQRGMASSSASQIGLKEQKKGLRKEMRQVLQGLSLQAMQQQSKTQKPATRASLHKLTACDPVIYLTLASPLEGRRGSGKSFQYSQKRFSFVHRALAVLDLLQLRAVKHQALLGHLCC